MSSNQFLSIGVPVYNQVKTIKETLDSVLNQTVPFAEVLVSDNHSNDGTSEILATYSDRIKIVRPDRHLGMIQNWNFVFSQMNSPWGALMSGDDLALPNFVADVQSAISRYPKAAMVRGDWKIIGDNSEFIKNHRQFSVAEVTKPPKTYLEQMYGPKANFAAFAIPRSQWEEVGGFPEQYHLYGDWAMWLRLAPLGDFIRVKKFISCYRHSERPTIKMSRLVLTIEDEWSISTVDYNNLLKLGVPEKIVHQARRSRLIWLLNHLQSHNAVIDEKANQWLQDLAVLSAMQNELTAWLKNPTPIAPERGNKPMRLARDMVRKIFG